MSITLEQRLHARLEQVQHQCSNNHGSRSLWDYRYTVLEIISVGIKMYVKCCTNATFVVGKCTRSACLGEKQVIEIRGLVLQHISKTYKGSLAEEFLVFQ